MLTHYFRIMTHFIKNNAFFGERFVITLKIPSYMIRNLE